MSLDSLTVVTDPPLPSLRDLYEAGSDGVGSSSVVVFAAVSVAGKASFIDPDIPALAPLAAVVQEQLPLLGFSASADELQRIVVEGVRCAVIGLGKKKDVTSLRYAAASAIRQLAGEKSAHLALGAGDIAETQAVLTGAALGSYDYLPYRHATLSDRKRALSQVTVIGAGQVEGADPERALVEARAVATVKDLFNQPALDLYPESFVQYVRSAIAGLDVELTVWDELKLAIEGFGGILGVGQGSPRPPRLVKLSYSPEGATKHVALVGKGITFDSGGLDLKTHTSMLGMKGDMTGAAIVFATLVAVAKLGLPVRVTSWLCLAENMPSGMAIRPNDVLRIRGGKTVEVLNTDAEGRLVLADGLARASEEHPDEIIDVATLTGAKVTALGNRYSAVMGDDDLSSQIIAQAKETGELLWPMPMPEELRADLNSDVADLANVKMGGSGGMLTAAHFLREFVGRQSQTEDASHIPWAHVDIAGCEEHKGAPYGFTGHGGTGVLVRTLIAHAEHLAQTLTPRS